MKGQLCDILEQIPLKCTVVAYSLFVTCLNAMQMLK